MEDSSGSLPQALNPLSRDTSAKKKIFKVRGGAARQSSSHASIGDVAGSPQDEEADNARHQQPSRDESRMRMEVEQDEDDEQDAEKGLDLLLKKNADDNDDTMNEHGILKVYQVDGHGETGGIHQQSTPYLSFKQAKALKAQHHPHFRVTVENKDTGEVEHAYEPLPLTISTGWHVMKGEGFITVASYGILLLFLLVIITMMGASAKGAAHNDSDTATAFMVFAALLVTMIVALLCLIAFATVVDTLTFDTGDPRKSGKKIYEYGVGIVLYFRWLKFMACLFFFMSILSVPALFFYHSGTVLDLENTPGLTKLASLTLGSIGESTPLCYQESTTNSTLDDDFYDDFYHINHTVKGYIELKCPVGQITELKVLYGNPSGWCGCHDLFRPSETGTCASPVIEHEDTKLRQMFFKYVLNQGFYDEYMDETQLQTWKDSSKLDFELLQNVMSDQKWTRAKERVLKQECCGTKFPVEFYHQPESNPSCASDTMQAIADTACLGKNSCNLTMNEGAPQVRALPVQ
jgi:hypothetical protein